MPHGIASAVVPANPQTGEERADAPHDSRQWDIRRCGRNIKANIVELRLHAYTVNGFPSCGTPTSKL
jgi:hypothetical protein